MPFGDTVSTNGDYALATSGPGNLWVSERTAAFHKVGKTWTRLATAGWSAESISTDSTKDAWLAGSKAHGGTAVRRWNGSKLLTRNPPGSAELGESDLSVVDRVVWFTAYSFGDAKASTNE